MSWLSGGVSRIDKAAKERLRQRLAERMSVGVPELLQAASVPSGLHAAAEALVTQLGGVLGCDPGLLRATDRLGELLLVDARELPSISVEDWDRAGLRGRLVVHSYDILHLVETFSDGSKWKARWASLQAPPRNEEQWIDFILTMNVGDFIGFFAPLAKETG